MKIDFGAMPWEEWAPFARSKMVELDHERLRLLELKRGFEEPDWCRKRHVGYVLAGELEIRFAEHSIRLSAGDGLFIPQDEKTKHRAHVLSDTVQLVLVEQT